MKKFCKAEKVFHCLKKKKKKKERKKERKKEKRRHETISSRHENISLLEKAT